MSGYLQSRIDAWLAEDLGHEDVTTVSCVPAEQQARGRLVAKATGITVVRNPDAGKK